MVIYMLLFLEVAFYLYAVQHHECQGGVVKAEMH